jgi:hypothetical protein
MLTVRSANPFQSMLVASPAWGRSRDLTDHRVGRAALEVVEQERPQGLHVDAIFFHEQAHRGFEAKSFGAVDRCEVFTDVPLIKLLSMRPRPARSQRESREKSLRRIPA